MKTHASTKALGLVLLGLVAAGCSFSFSSHGGGEQPGYGSYGKPIRTTYDDSRRSRPKPIAKVSNKPVTEAASGKDESVPTRTKAEPPRRTRPTPPPPRRTRPTPQSTTPTREPSKPAATRKPTRDEPSKPAATRKPTRDEPSQPAATRKPSERKPVPTRSKAKGWRRAE